MFKLHERKEFVVILVQESFNWILAALLFVVSKVVNYFVPPFQRKFSVNDTTIGFPHSPDTVNNLWLWLISLLFPAVVIIVVGLKRRNLRETHNALLGIFFSTALAYLICHITKNLVGRHRPDFLDRCQPSLNSEGVPSIAPVFGLNDNSVCTQTDINLLRSGSQSFFSGHTSTAFSGLGFLSLYLAYVFGLWKRSGQIYKTWIVLAPLMVALFIGLSRISDYRHHWQDVVVGLIFGELTAIYCFYQFFTYFPSKPSSHPPVSSTEYQNSPIINF